MKAIILPRIAPIEERPLQEIEVPRPVPNDGEMLIQVLACGICHTDLDEIEGRLPPARLPMVLGHQVVGRVIEVGRTVTRYAEGDRVGVTWLYSSCGRCAFCRTQRENLCHRAKWTGKDVWGGYAEYMVVNPDFVHPIPPAFSDIEAAPLLCAGVIGYRALRLADVTDGQTVGLFGFGASAHIVIQLIRHLFGRCTVCVFTRGDAHKALATHLGAAWTGAPDEIPSDKLDRIIDFTPVGSTVKHALAVLNRGGRLVINAIRKTTPIPELHYDQHLWDEKELKSVANVTRRDAETFLPLAAEIPIVPTVRQFAPRQANEALNLLKRARLEAAAVLRRTPHD